MKKAATRTLHRRSAIRLAVPATEAAKNFGRLVDRVREQRAVYVVERGGVPVAQLGPVDRTRFTMADLKGLAGAPSAAANEYLREVERAVTRHARPRLRSNPSDR